ncbi:hypothetical protein [Serratia marcescens]|uniref:hypothetical protein n=1 Tax=Serratia marcescens TaxID=615 RepID=UPI000DFB8A2A|nr:hypothetical protein [Serratia marcescens]SUI52058.1 Uncharacterised protein [Serratia marcescens]
MDNNLSELSKPIGVSFKSDIDLMKSGRMIHGQMTVWKSTVGIPESQEGVYSQEYVSALLADNEHLARELVARNGENEWLRKRAAELEAEITNIVDSHAETVAELRAKLATPVRLPSEHELHQVACSECAGNCLELVEGTVRAAGFTVEGDE